MTQAGGTMEDGGQLDFADTRTKRDDYIESNEIKFDVPLQSSINDPSAV
jgi:hypothetical protein